MATRSASRSGRASAASVTAMMSAYGRAPHSRCARAMKPSPYPVDSAGSGSSTA